MKHTRLASVIFCVVCSLSFMCSAADQAAFNGKAYSSNWRNYATDHLRVTVDSRGMITVKTGAAAMTLGLSPIMGGGAWRRAEFMDVPSVRDGRTVTNGFEITGEATGGANVVLSVTVADDAVSCVCSSDAPASLVGTFPVVPEANWFRSQDGAGKNIQGELWGEFQDLSLHDFIEYTYLERRLRLEFGSDQPLVLHSGASPRPGEYALIPSSFNLAFTKTNSAHRIRFAVKSLSPDRAPLADPASPVVTRPFDPRRLMHPTDTLPARFVAQGGRPPIFKQKETPAFRLTLPDGWKPGTKTEIRCVAAMSDAVVQALPVPQIEQGVCDVVLKALTKGPYRL
ncbi:MAG: hypothetical protein PHR35_18635, partial [Kiritimatiellae bacterium]|nr:hypothetical protein [Kiritimatiellia bacterium]